MAGAGSIQVDTPLVSVVLFKLVGRKDGVSERYVGSPMAVDLTPVLGEGGVIRTVKSVHEPAGGFSISVGDSGYTVGDDTVYALVEPGDMVEIRATRFPERYAGRKLPLIMRGFVQAVRRSEAIGGDGVPERTVVITGQDAGRFWLINQILFELSYLDSNPNPYLTTFHMQAATGIDPNMMPVSEFMRQVTERVINKQVEQLSVFSSRQIAKFRVEATVKQGIASNIMVAPFQGPVWNLVEAFADRPWNEVFVEDEDAGPVLRFREAPYKGIDGKFIMPNAVEPGTIVVEADKVLALDVQRSDARVANFFWVPPGSSMLHTAQMVNVASLQAGEPLDFEYGNNKPELYGVRRMQLETRLLPNDLASLPSLLPPSQQGAAGDKVVLWHKVRGAQLKAMNRDNVVLEEGSAMLQGVEDLKAGRFLRLKRGELTSEAYMPRVSHNIAPLRSWTTNVTLERGTGFLERSKFTGSPYWAEGRRGPYSK
ncbi:hypothetical protein [Azospirillum sp.]|uniref:hypothetical protein n=1 Tax=Azospirillum sp. TaxID=34012 RepID=UPI003D713A4C